MTDSKAEFVAIIMKAQKERADKLRREGRDYIQESYNRNMKKQHKKRRR